MERTYIIPLRREWLKVPLYKRTAKAVRATRAFLQRHMKLERVKLGRMLNMNLWTNGNRNPPHKVEVSAEVMKDDEGDYVYAEVVGVAKEPLKLIAEKKKVAEKTEEVKDKSTEEKAEKEKVLKEVPFNQEQPAPIAEEHHKHHNKEEAEKDRGKYIYTKETRKER